MFGNPEDLGLIDPKKTVKASKAVTDLEIMVNNTSETIHIEEKGDVAEQNMGLWPVVNWVQERFVNAKNNRSWDEDRWETVYQNYRGLYGPDVQFLDTEKSRAFIKVTKTKVLAAYGQTLDILFANQKFPIGIEATHVPIGVDDAVHIDLASPPGQEVPKQKKRDTTRKELQVTPAMKEEYGEEVMGKIQVGEGLTPSAYTMYPADDAARLMEKQIHDQLDEANATKSLRSTIMEMCLFGTGIFKGPFTVEKEYPRWNENGEYVPETIISPEVSHVSVWDAYPDPDARSMEECEFFIQRHRMNKSDLRSLKHRPYFRDESIDMAIAEGPNYQMQDWEYTLIDKEDNDHNTRYEVLEYWGIIDSEIIEELGEEFDLPDEYKDFDEVQVNIWICNNQLLRLVMNPFTPMRIPFYAVPYEHNPYSFFGIGVAENMIDTQQIMNGFLRLAVDNAVLSGNLMFEVDDASLAPGQSLKLEPGKVFVRQGGVPGQAFFSHKVQNVTNECLQMFDKARQLADEATGMPSYAHGGVGVSGVGKTASGMSMLMGAAALNIKSVVKNIDDYLLTPLGEAMYAFNMQFNFDKKFVGDLAVTAKGTESLMRNEVRSQKLMQFMQLTANPAFAPFIKIDYILKEIAASLDLDPDRIINDPKQAALQAQIMGTNNAAQAGPQQPSGAGPQGGPPQSPQAQGTPAGPGGTGALGTPQPGTNPAGEGTPTAPGDGSFQGNPAAQGPMNG
jgi:hypothetical protein